MFKIGTGKCLSAVLTAFWAVILSASAGTTNVVPFSEDFESYTNYTPLNDGTNGWYASSNIVVVQPNVFYAGNKAAMIPPCTSLSNLFVETNSIMASMYVRPSLSDIDPLAYTYLRTNSTAVFYVNTAGYCTVYNGTNDWTNLTTKTDGSAATPLTDSQWTRFDLRIDHTNRTWALAANNEILRTNIAFATNYAFFSGFDVYNVGLTNDASTTNYLDNVSVTYIPNLDVDITNISRTILLTQNVPSNSFQVWNSSGNVGMPFTNGISYSTNCLVWTNWLSVTPTNNISHGELKTIWLVFNTTNLPASNQAYQATVQVQGTDETFGMGVAPKSILVSVTVQNSYPPQLGISPLNLTNSATVGYRASDQQITIANTSATPHVSMTYSVVSRTSWISVSPSSGSVVDNTNTVILTYSTESLTAGWHTGTITVTASGVATQDVPVVMRVNNIPSLSCTPQALSNTVTEGETLSANTFEIWNGSSEPKGTMRFTLSDNANWLSLSTTGGTNWGDHQTVSVNYDVSSLSPGAYTGIITFAGTDQSSGAAVSNSPLTIVAYLTVIGRVTLSTDTDSLSNSVLQNCQSTSTFNIWNGATTPRGGLSYSITTNVSWLSVSPSSGIITNNTKTITVTWTTGNNAPGVYNGSIIVDGTDSLTGTRARNAPKIINARMTVLSRSPVNYEKPTISGTPYIGQTLNANNGLWQNMNRLTFAYQWQRVNDTAGTVSTDLSGETTTNHVIVTDDHGKYMRIAVTATDANPTPLSATAYSELLSSTKVKALPGDFNGDAIADLWFFDSSAGMWHASFNANSFAEGQFGSFGMTDVPRDYNGDGILDLGLYNNADGMWYILLMPSGTMLSGSMFGGITEETLATPVPADYDGDGVADVALYYYGYWAILYSSLGRIVIIPPIAGATALPAPEDYDGDGIDDLGVYDSGLWTIFSALGEKWSVSFGSSAWLPAAADYDGDAIADLCIFNQAANVWMMTYSTSGTTTNSMFRSPTRSFGTSLGGNVPRQGYYDHDRYCDPATLHYSADGDFIIWCVTRTRETNFPYRGQTYQRSINDWRVSW